MQILQILDIFFTAIVECGWRCVMPRAIAECTSMRSSSSQAECCSCSGLSPCGSASSSGRPTCSSTVVATFDLGILSDNHTGYNFASSSRSI
ncbi:hypothetical protein BHM03_00003488 [Ensete ventricosum]|nr:hypothetical protein BHM03_00003488 [Ensete ventricosum]